MITLSMHRVSGSYLNALGGAMTSCSLRFYRLAKSWLEQADHPILPKQWLSLKPCANLVLHFFLTMEAR